MTFYKPLGPNGIVIIIVSGKAGREKNLPGPQKVMDFLTTLRHMVDFGSHFSAHWISERGPQICIFCFEKKRKKINEKNEVQETGRKKHDLLFIFDAKMGGMKL